MDGVDEFRARERAIWASGDWDGFSARIANVGTRVLDHLRTGPGRRLLDVGTGSGGTIAVPAALRGADVVGLDLTPELLEHARGRADAAGVEVEWVEGDAQQLPFPDASFDQVTSTFGAMFAPDHARAAAELVRVCRPGGRVIMTTWTAEGFIGELFKQTGAFLPPPPPGAQGPPLWGDEDHIAEMFAAAGVTPVLTRASNDFKFDSVEEMVACYARDFGPFVMARRMLEPQGRWEGFLSAFADVVRRFDRGSGDSTVVPADYFLITVDR